MAWRRTGVVDWQPRLRGFRGIPRGSLMLARGIPLRRCGADQSPWTGDSLWGSAGPAAGSG
jgi:hypothetical protein